MDWKINLQIPVKTNDKKCLFNEIVIDIHWPENTLGIHLSILTLALGI